MIDAKWIGHQTGASILPIERSRLRLFARAIGETDPVYTDVEAAKAAGYVDLPAPPTFLFSAELDSGALDELVGMLSLCMTRLLHGEQSFTYHRTVCAGEVVSVTSCIENIYSKKNGALEFVVKKSSATDSAGQVVAEMRTVLAYRNPV